MTALGIPARSETGLRSTRLVQQPDLPDTNPVAQRFAHVIDSQGGHGDCRQSFHLHAGLPSGFRGGAENNFTGRRVELMSDSDDVQRNVMAEWNEVPSLLGRRDAGQFGRCENVAFLNFVCLDFAEYFLAHGDTSFGGGYSVGHRFPGDGDHVGFPVARVDVTEFPG